MHENRYVESSGKEYLANDTTNSKIGCKDNGPVHSNFIYTPGIESRSIKNSISPKPEYNSEPEDENSILSRQIIEDFILQHSSPAPSSGTHSDSDSALAPTSSTSPRTSTSTSSQASRTRLAISERNHVLASDTRTDLVKSDKVQCGKCKEWIRVSSTSIYGWEKHVNTCFNVNNLTPLQIAKRIELAGDIRVTSFGPRHVECAFCCSRVKLKGIEDYTLKSWKLHIAHCRGWNEGQNHITPQLAGQNQSDISPIERSTARNERYQRARKRALSRGNVIRWPLSSRADLRSSAIRRRLRSATMDQRSTKPSRPFDRLYQRTAGRGSHKKSRTGVREFTTAVSVHPSPGSTIASPHHGNDQPTPGAKISRPIDTRPSANTRARAVAYTRPEYLKQRVIGRSEWTRS